jgi:predicted CoA-binding protein
MDYLIKQFQAQKNVAVIGSFANENKFAYKILKKLIAKGANAIPIHPTIKEVEGMQCYKSVMDYPGKIDAANLVTPPVVTETIVEECLKKGISFVWMQPGAESEKAIKFCKTNFINVIYNTCLLQA